MWVWRQRMSFTVDPSKHMGLVHAVVNKNARPGEDVDELVSACSMAMVRACMGFDPSMGFKFSTYAHRAILNAIRLHRRNQARAWSGIDDDIRRNLPAAQAVHHFEIEDEAEDIRLRAGRAMESLTDKQRTVLMRRAAGEPLRVIAKDMGCTRAWVQEIERASIAQVRAEHGMEDDGRTFTKGPHRKPGRLKREAYRVRDRRKKAG